MSFKELEQKHNLINRVIVACGKRPTDADIHPLLEERLERFYEDATVEGMSMQMMRSVDRAVNAMAKPWVGLTDDDWGQLWQDFEDACDEWEFAYQEEAQKKHGEGHYYISSEDQWEGDKRTIRDLVEAKLKEKNGGAI